VRGAKISTRYEEGVLKILHDLGGGAKILHDYIESGRCSLPQYDIPEEQVYDDGEYWWSCTCYVRTWSITKTALSKSKKGAKKYAAYLVLCDFFGMEPEEE
jgi:ribonuclease III